jgi:hypothetical protein
MGKGKMFSKLEAKVKKIKLTEKAINLSSHSDRRLLESSIIFGGLVDELSSLDIEAAYSGITEAEGDAMAAASSAQSQAREAQEDARKQIQVASIDRQMKSIEDRNESQLERLRNRKERVAGINEEESYKSMAVKAFFIGRDGGILNYLVNGELALIDPELKSLAKKLRSDPVVRDLAAKAKSQLQSESPNMEALKVIKYKLMSRIQMLESMEKEREVTR